MTPHNIVAFTVRFHGGPLDGLKAGWCERYDAEHFLPRPSVVYATEADNEVVEVSRRHIATCERYEVEPGADQVLDVRYAPG